MIEQSGIQVFFVYRYFTIYQMGVERDLSKKVNAVPLLLLSNITFFHQLNQTIANRILKSIIKLPFWLLKKIGIYSLYNYFVLRKTIARIRPDLIHVNNGGYPGSSICLNAVFAAKHCGIKRIVFHINNPAGKPSNSIQRFIDSKISKYTQIFVSGSKQTIESLRTSRGFNNNKLLQIYNTIEQPIITNKREEILEKYNIDNRKFIITEVAFLSKRKGQIYLLKAILKIKERQPDIYKNTFVFLVGDGEDHSYLYEFCKRNELSNVIFTGYLFNFLDYINAADLFILPSIGGEDMPLVILAAMALRKPIISTCVAGIMEEIENGVSGILLETSELEFLDDQIIKLYGDKALRKLYAENAQKQYNNLFLRENICSQFKLLYEKLMDQKL